MGAVLFVSSIANMYKSDEHCFKATFQCLDEIDRKIDAIKEEEKLLKKAQQPGEISAMYVPVFDFGSRFYSELLANKRLSERHTDKRVNKLYRYPDSGQSKFPGMHYKTFSITVNGREYSLQSALTRIELPEGEYDITLNIALNYTMNTFGDNCINENLSFKKTSHIYIRDGYNFLQVKGTVFFNKTYSGKHYYNHEFVVYVFEAPSKMDFDMRLIPYDEFNDKLPGNQYDVQYPGNIYFKYSYEDDTLLTEEERNEELKKARGSVSRGAVKPSAPSDTQKKSNTVAKNPSSSPVKQEAKPDKVGLYGKNSQLSKAMRALNDSSKEAADELNASYNELMSVLRSGKPKYSPPPVPKKPTPEEEAYQRRVDEFWAADKKAYEERIRLEEEEKRKKEEELKAQLLKEEQAKKTRLEVEARVKRLEQEKREKAAKAAEEKRKELERKKKEERLAMIASEKALQEKQSEAKISKELCDKYKDIFSFKGITLSEYKSTAPNVTIPDFVKKIDSKFFQNKNIKSVIIEADIHSLTERMFSDTDIQEITLSKSVKSIERHCFKNCKKLRSIKGGEISSIGEGAFMGCEWLEAVELEFSKINLHLGKESFKDCKKLRSIFIKSYDIPDSCFENCGKLESVYLTDTKAIGNGSFKNCTSLKKLSISALMKSNNAKTGEAIGRSAFEKCRALKSFTTPAKSISIENDAFKDCDSLCLVHFSYDATACENSEISGKCSFESAFSGCPSLKKIIYNGDKSAVKSLDPSGKCPYKVKKKLKEKDIK